MESAWNFRGRVCLEFSGQGIGSAWVLQGRGKNLLVTSGGRVDSAWNFQGRGSILVKFWRKFRWDGGKKRFLNSGVREKIGIALCLEIQNLHRAYLIFCQQIIVFSTYDTFFWKHMLALFWKWRSRMITYCRPCQLEMCKSNPNPIRSDSFGFGAINRNFGSDRIRKFVRQSDRIGLESCMAVGSDRITIHEFETIKPYCWEINAIC